MRPHSRQRLLPRTALAGKTKFDQICLGCHTPHLERARVPLDILNALGNQAAMQGLFRIS
jgi:hypothetical protein